MVKNGVIIILSQLFALSLYAQKEGQNEDRSEYEEESKWAISLSMINSHVPEIEDSKSRVIVPAWGVGLEYELNERWLLVFLTELEIMSYIVELGEGEELEREFPVITVLGFGYEFLPRAVLDVGFGREFEKTESFNLLHLAASYNFELPDNWSAGPGISMNSRFDGFPTYSFKLGVSKSF